MNRLKEMEVKRNLRRRITEIYGETSNVVNIEQERTEKFSTTRMPAAKPDTLRCISVGHGTGQEGGVVTGVGMKGMLKSFRKYAERKGLTVNTDKFKVLVFQRGRGKGRRRREWRCGEEELEEAKEMKHLGYVMEKNGKAEKHTRERMRKAAAVAMKRTWHIGERLFKEDFERRTKMFVALVESVAMYGAEIWGWNDEGSLDAIKRRYTKWILGLDKVTPNYILREVTGEEEIRTKAVRRAVNYEERRAGLKGRRRESKEKDRGGGRGEREKKDRRIQVQRTLRGNRDERRAAGIPETENEKERKESGGNEARARRHWREEESRRCGMCKEQEETLEHV